MQMLFKREVLISRDLNQVNRIRDLLSQHKIDTTVSTNSLGSLGRYHGIPNISASDAYEYRVYVKRKDYEIAKAVLKK